MKEQLVSLTQTQALELVSKGLKSKKHSWYPFSTEEGFKQSFLFEDKDVKWKITVTLSHE
jgi:hypothetical protein